MMAVLEIAILVCFGILMVLGGILLDSIAELRQIKRAKLVRSIRNHPAGKAR